MRTERKLIPIELDFTGVEQNATVDELKIMIAELDAAINRCCKTCDEPAKIMRMIKENGYLYGG